jgi:hypothetical protein
MAPTFTLLGMFCEDIREEKNGQDTIVGVLPDHIEIPRLSGSFAKIAVYLRFAFTPDSSVSNISYWIEMLDGTKIKKEVDGKLILKAKDDSRESGHPLATIIARIRMGPVLVNNEGRFNLHASIDGDETLVSSLNVKLANDRVVSDVGPST